MDENRARRITDGLRDRGINAHLRKSGIEGGVFRRFIDGFRDDSE